MLESPEKVALNGSGISSRDPSANNNHIRKSLAVSEVLSELPYSTGARSTDMAPHCPRTYPTTVFSTLLGFLKAVRVLPSRNQALFGVSFFFGIYYILAVSHSVLWVGEVLLGYVSSTFLLLCLRFRSGKIIELSKEIAVEFGKCHSNSILALKIVSAIMISILVILCLGWEILDLVAYGSGFLETMQSPVFIAVFNRHIKLYQMLCVWFSLGTTITILMNTAMIFFAVTVLALYCCWREINIRLKRDLFYLLNDFEVEWERLRQLAERTDDFFSSALFISWGADIVCAVGYLGSLVIYGGGSPIEQAYTVFGFFIHAIWNPGCCLIPCILFDEEMMSTRQIVMGAVHREMDGTRRTGVKDPHRMMHLNLILQTVAYRPVAFTAWKFFYVNRNVILTISTVMVSYALVLVQLVGRKHEVISTNGTAVEGFGQNLLEATLGVNVTGNSNFTA
ncbi:hypothetical protein BV898_13335 [Hypsibius exemplaris]|uniref:Gustatory receptor n=1 Tax=Hypsibius exemplaris TaxID=2072580 RepID=A0A1W0WB35_HYPEX|nr:hypothetical protein BV898_13335 [Hypsibius exemplaris]